MSGVENVSTSANVSSIPVNEAANAAANATMLGSALNAIKGAGSAVGGAVLGSYNFLKDSALAVPGKVQANPVTTAGIVLGVAAVATAVYFAVQKPAKKATPAPRPAPVQTIAAAPQKGGKVVKGRRG